MKKEKTLSVRQAAVRLNYHLQYVYMLLYAQRIPGAQKIDGEWLLPADGVEALAQKRLAKAARRKPASTTALGMS